MHYFPLMQNPTTPKEQAMIEVQIVPMGTSGRKTYGLNVKVNGRCVAFQTFATRAQAMKAAPDLVNQYR